MPELPDLLYIEKKLRPVVLHEEILEVAVWEPIVLRMGVPGSFSDVLRRKEIRDLRRHGPFLVFALPPLEMIVHFMLAGFFRINAKQAGGTSSPTLLKLEQPRKSPASIPRESIYFQRSSHFSYSERGYGAGATRCGCS